jgi:two-component system osmolarity sensor histidine kinase EnvZ
MPPTDPVLTAAVPDAGTVAPTRSPWRWLPDSLLWRTFLLIAALLLASLIAWIAIVDESESEPRARAIAQQVASIVNLTRAAIVTAAPEKRIELLRYLSQQEGIRIYPAGEEEPVVDLPDSERIRLITREVRNELGAHTQLKLEQEGLSGLLVSFRIAGEEYWLALPRERIERQLPWEWIGWSALAAALALIGAWFIVSRVNEPLRALTRAAAELAGGRRPKPIAEAGAAELRTLAHAFNRMTAALQRAEAERALLLAGVSHDLRTPLSRLRLGLELLGDTDRSVTDGMIQDIEDMDAIIEQFLDFARGEGGEAVDPQADLDAIVHAVAERYTRRQKPVSARTSGLPRLALRPMAMQRAIVNLVDNALRYSGTGVEIETHAHGADITVSVLDRGPGIPISEAERLLQPFTRLEGSRSGASGAGLGLAIVQRIAAAHGGRVDLLQRPGGGLEARITLHPARG